MVYEKCYQTINKVVCIMNGITHNYKCPECRKMFEESKMLEHRFNEHDLTLGEQIEDLPAGMEHHQRNTGNSSNTEDTEREEISQAEINRLYRMKEERNHEARKGNEEESRKIDEEIQNYQKVLKMKYGEKCLEDTKLSELTPYREITG